MKSQEQKALNVAKRRKGIHSKNKSSKIKTSRMYKKRYRGQGK